MVANEQLQADPNFLMNISFETFVACGLTDAQAQDWVSKIQQMGEDEGETSRWQRITSELLTPSVPFAVHELLYQQNYAQRIEQRLPCPAWFPTPEEVEATHVANWLQSLNLPTYQSLHEWSIKHPDDFARTLAEALQLRFRIPAQQFCDTTAGNANARWFAGASLNIVDSCFQADDTATAIVFGDADNQLERLTYGELNSLTARVANGLTARGVVPGDRVAIAMPMTSEAVAVFLGIIAAGCAAVTIADSFSASEMAVRLEMTQPKFIFVQDEILRGGRAYPLFAKIADSDVPAIVIRGLSRRNIALRVNDLEWDEFLSDDNVLRCVARQPDDETTILFSSGTTGFPKAIPWDHVTPIKSASDAYFHHDVHAGDVLCWPTNLGWMMGPWLVYAALMNQATIAISSAVPTSRTFCEFVEQSAVTMLGLVPSLVSQWRKEDHTKSLNWESIRLFSSTGECSNPNDMLWLMSRAGYKPVIEYCGGTETGGSYVTGTLTRPAVPGMFSTKSMGLSWILLDDAFTESTIGEVFFEPPALGLSTRLLHRDHHEVYYAGIPAGPQQQVLRRHGDQIEALPGGYFRAHGRIDDAMNLGGIKVSCVQIEELLVQHDAVRELAAISVPPPGGGPERLVIYVVLNCETDSVDLHQQLHQTIKSELNPLFKIHDVALIDALPRTASNKVMRRNLRDLYLCTHQE